MLSFFKNIGTYLEDLTMATPNKNLAHNIDILTQAKRKISTGLFSRYFKRPTIYVAEIVAYSITVCWILVAFYLWSKIDNIFDAYETLKLVSQTISPKELYLKSYSEYSYLFLFILILPSVISLLLARLLTTIRNRMNIFIEVENKIDKVIYNLKD